MHSGRSGVNVAKLYLFTSISILIVEINLYILPRLILYKYFFLPPRMWSTNATKTVFIRLILDEF